jgi:hypothetical protein
MIGTNDPSLPDRVSSWLELGHASTARALIVVVPERRLLTIQGAGSRSASDFHLAKEVLLGVRELIRAALAPDRRAERRPVLEVCWSVPQGLGVDGVVETLERPIRGWRQMVEVPGAASEADIEDAIDQARRLGGRTVPLVHALHLTEGAATQLLHLSGEDELLSVRKLYQFVADAGLRPAGDLHELVVADPLTVGLERGRSILRVPVAAVRA